jgi:hypothetical protein
MRTTGRGPSAGRATTTTIDGPRAKPLADHGPRPEWAGTFFAPIGKLKGMDATAQQPERGRTIDLSGLSEETARAVELLVSQLRSAQQPPAEPRRFGSFSSYEEWSKALREWVESHQPLHTNADYSRESIYPDRI